MSPNDKSDPRREVRRVEPGRRRPGPTSSQGDPAAAGHPAAHAVALESQHPQPATYIRVAVVLGVITAIEVGVFYVESLRPILAPLLFVLSATKFTLVAAFYMHLRFDNKIYRNLFVFGLFVAASILVAMLLINSYHAAVPGSGLV